MDNRHWRTIGVQSGSLLAAVCNYNTDYPTVKPWSRKLTSKYLKIFLIMWINDEIAREPAFAPYHFSNYHPPTSMRLLASDGITLDASVFSETRS